MDIVTYALLLKRIRAVENGEIVAVNFQIDNDGLLQYYINQSVEFTIDNDGNLQYEVELISG